MVKIKKQLITSNARTYGRNNRKRTVTVHQTGNTKPSATAQMHANLQSNLNPRGASWHWQVDDKEAIQSFDHSAQCWHAGDGRGPGNLDSIAVEICINDGADYKKAVENGANLVRKILDDEGLSVKDVKQHYDWSRKNCPAQIRAGKDGITWNDFLALVEGDIAESTDKKPDIPATKPKPKKPIGQMAQEIIDGRHGLGHDKRRKSLGISAAEYDKVRAEVNRRLNVSNKKEPKKSLATMIQEVIDGKHGNGHNTRRKSLGINATEYLAVKQGVNRRLSKQGNQKSISQMATEVIEGKHGNGHDNRRKSLGISAEKYAKVRKEVNRRS